MSESNLSESYLETVSSKLKPEPITLNDVEKVCMNPVSLPNIRQNYLDQRARFWTEDEIDHSVDYQSWLTLNENEQRFISFTLAFFANSDNLVFGNLVERMIQEITDPWIRAAWGWQAAMETIHAITYNNLIEAVIKNKDERIKLFRSIENNPVIQPKLQWASDLIKSEASLGERLVAWCFVEGVFFSSSFASMFWLRKRGKTPGITFANEKIVEDESLHVKLGALIYKDHIVNKLSDKKIQDMCRTVVEIEHKFVEDTLPTKLIGMNKELMKQYVCKTADVVLELLNVPKIYNVTNPFNWMDGLGLMGKANFFEKRVAEYHKTGKEDSIRATNIHNLGDDLDF